MPKLLAAVAALLWPLIVLLLFWRFAPLVADLLKSARTRRLTVKIAGQEFTLEEATERQGASLGDLLAQFGQLETKVAALAAASPVPLVAAPTAPIRSLLWVDDDPDDNRLYVAQLEEVGIVVELVPTTAVAVSRVEAKLPSSPYDVVVSDMGREEGSGYRKRAGIELLVALRELQATVPVILFCSRESAAQFGEEALQEGAVEVTSSPTRLLARLGYDQRKYARVEGRRPRG